MYTKPWTITLKQRIVVDAELIDEICLENEEFEDFVSGLKKEVTERPRTLTRARVSSFR